MSELYLKDKLVLTLRDKNGVPSEIHKINAPELLPFPLQKDLTIQSFNYWLNARTIPNSRDGIAQVCEEFGETWKNNVNYAALTDHYWLKRRSETWKKVSFFTRTYSKDIGDMFFIPWTINKKKYDTNSPDLTTGGITKKRWVQKEDKTSYLVKAGNEQTHQEPLSEVLASALIENLGFINSAGYDLCIEGTTLCSKTDNFITLDNDLVTADQIFNWETKETGESVYSHLVKMCDKLEIPGANEFLDNLIFVDSIIRNDRQLDKIGFLRDMNTMKFIGPAPVYDCGGAYWSKPNSGTRNNPFMDVAAGIFNKKKKAYDIRVLSREREYEKFIMDYPSIEPDRKEMLINAIKNRNEELCKTPDLDVER